METDQQDTLQPTPSDPPQDQAGTTMPARTAFVLNALGIILTFGRHLRDTIRQRATAPNFGTIAAVFGTANVETISAHLERGIRRVIALQRVLLARGAAGRDIPDIPNRKDQPQPAPADAEAAPKPQRKPRSSPSPDWNDNPQLHMPTEEELVRQIRRRSVGRVLAEICLDLAVVPGLCSSDFWYDLFEIMYYTPGKGLVVLMQEKHRREQQFIKEQDRTIDSNWDWLHLKPNAIRQVLGFYIGEPPVDPFHRLPLPRKRGRVGEGVQRPPARDWPQPAPPF